jgi:serine/threonine-protein kinase
MAQRTLDLNLVSDRQLDQVWSELGSRNVPIEAFGAALVRSGLLTNYQIDRMVAGERSGFFYGDFKILYLVGVGTFARVYRAAHRETNKLVAVKVLRSRLSEIPEEVDRFIREGKLGQTLKHPNIVPIIEVCSDRRKHYIVMDFVEGNNLREFMRARKVLDPLVATRLILDICNGLSYAAERGLSHRDLKMTNVLVSSRGQARLVDFGLAGEDPAASEEALENANPRTIDYAGLERSSGVRRDDSRSDLFFAGCIYYQMLTGQPPLSETRDKMQRMSKSRFQEIKPVFDVAPDLPMGVALVVNRAIEFDPEKRYQSAADMATDLQSLLVRLRAAEASSGGGEGVQLQSEEGFDKNGQQRSVMIVESDVKMQDAFRELLKKNGYRVLVMSNPERAIQRFREAPDVANAVMLDAASLGESAVAAFNQLGENPMTKDVSAILLLHRKQAAWEERAKAGENRRVERMPISGKALRRVLVELLADKEQEPAGTKD